MHNETPPSGSYTAESITVLSGLDPVRQRPGMYTDTRRPNHLLREVLDNSVDEALSGYATEIQVGHYKDGSLEVSDNGRGMPVDVHPEHGISGVELIMTKLHAGGKFAGTQYRFSGGLHGVGVSVVNALSTRLVVRIQRGGKQYEMCFKGGDPEGPLTVIGRAPKGASGTRVHFWPDPQYFDVATCALQALKHDLRAKAVLCPNLTVSFTDEASDTTETWCYAQGLCDYLMGTLGDQPCVPQAPFVGNFEAETEAVEWAVVWLLESGGATMKESYVNLIATVQGGTHVNGFRTGLLEAMRDFCAMHQLLPRGVQLVADDIMEHAQYVLSVKLQETQFSGQTKERLSARRCAAFVSGVVRDALSLWLNQHVEVGKALAASVLEAAQQRLRLAKKVVRKKVTSGPALPGKLADCAHTDPALCELFLVEGDSAGGSAKQARDKNYQAIMPLRGKILNTWEVASDQVLASQSVHDIAVAIGVDPGASDLAALRYGKVCILADADSDGLHIASLLCALFVRHFAPLVKAGHIHVAMPPLYRIDVGKKVYYALDDEEKAGVLDRIAAEKQRGTVNIQRFKGLGEMNPMQLRETTMMPDTRRLVQLTLAEGDEAQGVMDTLLAKKRAADRRHWLEQNGGSFHE